MANKRKTYVKMTSPLGIAVYPHLNKPDTRFNKFGEYRVRLALEESDPKTQAFLEKLREHYDLAYENNLEEEGKKKLKKADLPYTQEEDDQGEPTGRIIVNFKCRAIIKTRKGDKFENKPSLRDSLNKKMDESVGIWGGSKVVVGFEIVPYYTSMVGSGISLRLKAVQVKELVTSGDSVDAFDFDVDEDGYQFDESQVKPKQQPVDSDDDEWNNHDDDVDSDKGDDEEDF